jgi:hypothetical protein
MCIQTCSRAATTVQTRARTCTWAATIKGAGGPASEGVRNRRTAHACRSSLSPPPATRLPAGASLPQSTLTLLARAACKAASLSSVCALSTQAAAEGCGSAHQARNTHACAHTHAETRTQGRTPRSTRHTRPHAIQVPTCWVAQAIDSRGRGGQAAPTVTPWHARVPRPCALKCGWLSCCELLSPACKKADDAHC